VGLQKQLKESWTYISDNLPNNVKIIHSDDNERNETATLNPSGYSSLAILELCYIEINGKYIYLYLILVMVWFPQM
jgi:hypothetical protein